MTKTSAAITDDQRAFIEAQPLALFAATADDGAIRLDAGGTDRLRIIAPDLVAWLDSDDGTPPTSGAHAHIALMVCAFDGSQRTVRLQGRGKAILPDDDEWDIAAAPFASATGARRIVVVSVEQVVEGAGTGLPVLTWERPAAPDRAQDTPPTEARGKVGHGWVGAVLNYWLNEIGPDGWFASSDEEDARCAHLFRSLWEALRDEPADAFLDDADMALAAIVLFDQFPRNMFRGHARAFATDALARDIARAAIDRDYDDTFVNSARSFFYLPFMHSEELADQERSLDLFSQPGFEFNLPFAKAHHAIVARFGRFPHRNAVLGRETLPEEEEAVREGSHW